MTTPLSPAAQAVLDTLNEQFYELNSQHMAAAVVALRAVADQVAPERVNPLGDEHDNARNAQWARIRCKLFDIADELEAHQ